MEKWLGLENPTIAPISAMVCEDSLSRALACRSVGPAGTDTGWCGTPRGNAVMNTATGMFACCASVSRVIVEAMLSWRSSMIFERAVASSVSGLRRSVS